MFRVVRSLIILFNSVSFFHSCRSVVSLVFDGRISDATVLRVSMMFFDILFVFACCSLTFDRLSLIALTYVCRIFLLCRAFISGRTAFGGDLRFLRAFLVHGVHNVVLSKRWSVSKSYSGSARQC